MKNIIDKERTHLFSPAANIVVKAEIRGGAEIESLKAAIKKAVESNGILSNKIEINDSGDAWYEAIDKPAIGIGVTDMQWEDIAARQEKIRFEVERGELLRFFIIPGGNAVQILIIAHHLAGDGLSICFLIQDIMTALSGGELEYKPIELLSPGSLPAKSSLGGPMKAMINIMNRRWRKTGKVFLLPDFVRMFEGYWSERETVIYSCGLTSDRLDKLNCAAKEHSVTLNSVLTTALIRAAGGKADTGLAASIRKPGYEGMGNYATGISVIYEYDEKKDFWENAGAVQKLIYNKLDSDRRKLFLLQFMGRLEPTLIDAAYFAAFDGYKNKTAVRFQKMFGFSGKPKDLSITNLTRLPIKEEYGEYSLDELIFSAPLVANAKRIIGAAALGKSLRLSMHVMKDEEAGNNKALLEMAVSFMDELAD